MEGFRVFEPLQIRSQLGEYTVSFIKGGITDLDNESTDDALYIFDKKVGQLYQSKLHKILNTRRTIEIEASEENKTLDKFPEYIDKLIALKAKRGQLLVAVGGGIIQDITCFLAATFMRGLPWIFYPTTLLAQADSCIGSKSSINSGKIKNILGTFTPPKKIVVDVDFLDSLGKKDVCSGVGEMLKVHAIDSPYGFNKLASCYEVLFSDRSLMERFIYDSLLMKKKLIEIDEFDQGPRNVMNYGHSFGHAIESATDYAIPHGIAVSIGMDLANFVAVELGISNINHFKRMHSVLLKNYSLYSEVEIDARLLINALLKDKKNTHNQLKLILPDQEGRIGVGLYDYNERLTEAVIRFFKQNRYH